MPNPDRPQAPGYLANILARLFHERSGEGLHPLGIRPEQFPLLAELWFGPGATRASFVTSLEMDQAGIDALVKSLVDDGLIESFPTADAPLLLTAKARLARDAAVAAARGANDIARNALSPDELAQLMSLMNRVIDALLAARR
jgi:DNA-binding MarR family transcriptional regulator